MIRIEMNRLKHTVVLELPTDYEHVLVSLWKLGLDRDPVKYTLRELKVVFHYDTPEEHQMIRMIKSSDTLMFALISLHQMIAPPYSIANVLREKISSGCRETGLGTIDSVPIPNNPHADGGIYAAESTSGIKADIYHNKHQYRR